MHEDRIKDNDFLALTRQNENHLKPFSFVLQNGTQVEVQDTGVIVFTPVNVKERKFDLVLSCGIHGNETAPIELINSVIKSLLSEQITISCRTLFIIGNPMAINEGKRFVWENMNRLFSGQYAVKALQNKECERAQKIEMYVTRFFGQGGLIGFRKRMHFDLHCAIRGSLHERFAIYPYLYEKPWSQELLHILVQSNVSAVLLSNKPATSFSYFSSNNFQADALTIEVGQVRPFGENNSAVYCELRETLCELITKGNLVKKEISMSASTIAVFKAYKTIYRQNDEFSFNFEQKIKNFTGFSKGQILGHDGDKPFYADVEGEAVIFPNDQVVIGQRALLTVVPYTIKENEWL